MKYITTKKQCQKQIDKLNNVCDTCGRKIVPLKTVDNGGSPTYWAGCMHGTDWGNYTAGVSKDTYDLAVKLVLEDYTPFKTEFEDKMDNERFEHNFGYAVFSACHIIRDIEYMKTNEPRYDKEQLKEHYVGK